MAGAIIGAAIGAGASGASSGMGSMFQYLASKHERNRAWDRMQTWERIQPSLRVEGLRAAGLNPILATDAGGGGGANIPMASPGSAPHFDPDPVGRVISSAKQAKMMDSQVKLISEEVRKKEQEVEGQVQQNRLTETMADLAGHYGYAEKDLNIMAQKESILNLVAERSATGARENESRVNAAKLAVDKLLMEQGVSGARAMEEFYSKNPWARVIREFGGGSLIGTGAGAAAAAGGYLLGGDRERKRHPNQSFGELVPGHPKPKKRVR